MSCAKSQVARDRWSYQISQISRFHPVAKRPSREFFRSRPRKKMLGRQKTRPHSDRAVRLPPWSVWKTTTTRSTARIPLDSKGRLPLQSPPRRCSSFLLRFLRTISKRATPRVFARSPGNTVRSGAPICVWAVGVRRIGHPGSCCGMGVSLSGRYFTPSALIPQKLPATFAEHLAFSRPGGTRPNQGIP